MFSGFFMLDLDYYSSSCVAYNEDALNYVKWHVGLGHIGKDSMARLGVFYVSLAQPTHLGAN